MAAIYEWRCVAHNKEFESYSNEVPACPFGCTGSVITREFRTAPSIRSGGTTTIDRFTDHIASDYSLSNMSNDGGRGPDPSRGIYGPAGARRSWAPQQLARWTGKPFQFQEGWARRGEAPPVFNPQKPSMPDLRMTSSALRPVLEAPEGKNFLRHNTILHKPKRESSN